MAGRAAGAVLGWSGAIPGGTRGKGLIGVYYFYFSVLRFYSILV